MKLNAHYRLQVLQVVKSFTVISILTCIVNKILYIFSRVCYMNSHQQIKKMQKKYIIAKVMFKLLNK